MEAAGVREGRKGKHLCHWLPVAPTHPPVPPASVSWQVQGRQVVHIDRSYPKGIPIIRKAHPAVLQVQRQRQKKALV